MKDGVYTKRILLVSPFPPFIGGVSVSVQRLYEHLVGLGYSPARFDTQIKYKRLNNKIFKLLKYTLLPLYLLFHRRFDVIHFHVSNVLPKLYVSIWRPFFSRKTRFILTIHGSISAALKSRKGYYALRGFDRLICVKDGDAINIHEKLRRRAVEIPAFIPPARADFPCFPSGLERFLERNSFRILINGFLIINEKYNDLYGFGDAVKLVQRMNESGRGTDLIIIVLGSGYSAETLQLTVDLKDEVRRRKLDDHFLWLEGVTMDMWPLLKKVNLFLRPTKTDGDALSVRESLYLKVPVIASDIVPRPAGTITYDLNSPDDLLEKAVYVFDNYWKLISEAGDHMTNFANKILEQYDIK